MSLTMPSMIRNRNHGGTLYSEKLAQLEIVADNTNYVPIHIMVGLNNAQNRKLIVR